MVFQQVSIDFDELRFGLFEGPEDLIHDYQKYGQESFVFLFLSVGLSYEVLKTEKEKFQFSWPFKLY